MAVRRGGGQGEEPPGRPEGLASLGDDDADVVFDRHEVAPDLDHRGQRVGVMRVDDEITGDEGGGRGVPACLHVASLWHVDRWSATT